MFTLNPPAPGSLALPLPSMTGQADRATVRSAPPTPPSPSPTTTPKPVPAQPTLQRRAAATPLRGRLVCLLFCGVASLSGCGLTGLRATVPPDPAPTPEAPGAWMAALPHGGQTSDLVRWWEQFDDTLVARLVAAAQEANPSIATATSRLQQARSSLVAAGAAQLPRLDLREGISRTRADLVSPPSTLRSVAATASWEIDLFGAQATGREAASARLEAAQLGWHEARVLVAAEVALQYVALRACEAQLRLSERDAQSRAEVERLTALSERAGFQSPANLGLARASAAQGRSNVVAQRTACERMVKLLVELSAIPEARLRGELAARRTQLPTPASLRVTGMPAQVLQQRPDMARALREVRAAGAELAQAGALRKPQVSLGGFLGRSSIKSGNFSDAGRVWSFGPLQVSLPLFDGGRLESAEAGARARYVEAEALLKARVRTAVREVEDALLSLDSARERSDDAGLAVAGFQASLQGAETRYANGLASLFELEDARRSALQAQSARIDLQHQEVSSWIVLYKALGGGWSAAESSLSPAP